MTGKLYLLETFLITFICSVRCDYKCLCNYNVETEVFESPSDQGAAIGYLYEFDCKPVVPESTESGEWLTIAFEHQTGYVLKNGQIQVQVCPGAAPSEDKLTTTGVQKTSISSTTLKPVTSTLSSTTPTTATKASSTTTATTFSKIVTNSTTTLPTTAIPTTTALPTTIPTTTSSITTTTTTTQTTTTPIVTTQTTSASTETVSSLSTASKSPTAAFGLSTTTTTMTPSTVTSSSSPTTSAKTTTAKEQLMCPLAVQQRASREGGILFINNNDRTCYELVPHRHSWTYAEQDCQSKGGHLATIKDFSDEYVVYTHVKLNNHVVWIGLHDRYHEEHFEWSSGEPVLYTNWHAGRKNLLFHGIEDCVAMGPLSGTWEDMDCQDRYQYICEFDAVHSGKDNMTTPTPIGAYTDGNPAICPSFVKSSARRDNGILGQHGQSCFELVSHSKVSWIHGENMCRSRGGHLAHISSAEEQGFIQAFMNRHMPQHAVWIGLHDLNVEGHFQWTSGNAVSYTNWVPGHMSNFASFKTEDCVAFIPYKNGQWDDIPCGGQSFVFGDTGETHPILCQYDIQPSVIIG